MLGKLLSEFSKGYAFNILKDHGETHLVTDPDGEFTSRWLLKRLFDFPLFKYYKCNILAINIWKGTIFCERYMERAG